MDNVFLTTDRLTKRLLMVLPTGVYVVSNCYKPVGLNKHKPLFQEEVTIFEKRHVQWNRIKATRANGRLCHVYINRRDYEKCKSNH
ncbi:hypothetical protein KA005_66050 [bacterium]|nr:hypothetical protein [bacterium]